MPRLAHMLINAHFARRWRARCPPERRRFQKPTSFSSVYYCFMFSEQRYHAMSPMPLLFFRYRLPAIPLFYYQISLLFVCLPPLTIYRYLLRHPCLSRARASLLRSLSTTHIFRWPAHAEIRHHAAPSFHRSLFAHCSCRRLLTARWFFHAIGLIFYLLSPLPGSPTMPLH